MDLGLLILRVIPGLLFAGHGAQKLFGVFGGGGLEGTAGMFDNIGLRPGGLNARAAGTAEFLGGLLIALGLFTPFAGAALIAVMTAAVITVHAPNGVWNTNKGYEYNLVLVSAMFALAAIGAGAWSLDNAFGFDLHGVGWALGALAVGLIGGVGAVLSGHQAARFRERGAKPHAT
jgi:putative oxidoreductase